MPSRATLKKRNLSYAGTKIGETQSQIWFFEKYAEMASRADCATALSERWSSSRLQLLGEPEHDLCPCKNHKNNYTKICSNQSDSKTLYRRQQEATRLEAIASKLKAFTSSEHAILVTRSYYFHHLNS